jgi:hypothetical protein
LYEEIKDAEYVSDGVDYPGLGLESGLDAVKEMA